MDVHVIRRGHATAQVRVILRHAQEKNGEPGLELVATFMRERKGPDVIGVAFPDVKSVADALPVEDGAPNNPHTRFRLYHQLECRLIDGQLQDRASDASQTVDDNLGAHLLSLPRPAGKSTGVFRLERISFLTGTAHIATATCPGQKAHAPVACHAAFAQRPP